eukprot:CAMPEP_0175151768 /NCGR_PEP_ID=MMETSP0087-20121206/18709_1 /TAXON_ID=136419 /ORGANISM="Unknown Unknown, Strain D1" /LENGTH=541 /DNA_ID=CAMNT_0016438061 /DNA_START=15 /DNA_END=1636 /DNA_ORIENTATION=-
MESDNEEDDMFGSKESKTKDAVIFLVDCNPTMLEIADSQSQDGGEDTKLKHVTGMIRRFLKEKIISNPSDKVGIVLYNCKAQVNENDFKSLHVFLELDETTAQRIKQVEKLEDPAYFDREVGSVADGACPFYTALWACSTLFTNASLKDSHKRIFIITNNDNPDKGDPSLKDKAVQKADDLLELDIEVDIFPVASAHFDLNVFFRDVLVVDPNEQQQIAVAKSLDDLFEGFRKKLVKKRALTSVSFELGHGINIGVKLYVLNRPASREAGAWLDSKTNEPLTTVTQYVCEGTGTLLEDYQIKKYHTYGGAKVFFDKEEMKTVRTFGEPGLVLMGFKPLSALKVYHNIKNSYFCFPDDLSIKGSVTAFAALVTEMVHLKKFAVGRIIYRKNSGPRFVALLPQKEEHDATGAQTQPLGMHLIFLPFADDIRNLKVSETPIADAEAIFKAKQVVNSLKIDLSGDPPFDNPCLQQHYACLQALALEEDIPEDFEDEFLPDYQGMEMCAGVLNTFQQDCLEFETEQTREFNNRKRKGGGGGGGGGG